MGSVIITKSQLSKLKDFLETSGKKLLLYHQDCDGVCSTAMFLKFYKGFETHPRKGPKMERTIVKDILKYRPNLIVVLDIPIDQEWKTLKNIASELPECKWVIIDHHIITRDMNGKNIVHVNPRFKQKDAYIPVSAMMLEILKRLGKDVNGYIWVSAMGCIGDYAFNCKPVYLCKKHYPELFEPRARIKSGVERVSAIISAKESEGAEMVLDILLKSEDFNSFEAEKELKIWKERIDEEIHKLIEIFEKKKCVDEKIHLITYEINTRFGLTAMISSTISEMFPEYVILVYKKSGDGWKISLRCQSGKVDLNRVIRKCLEKGDSGGGHEKAAGGFVYNIEVFKECLKKQLSEIYGKNPCDKNKA